MPNDGDLWPDLNYSDNGTKFPPTEARQFTEERTWYDLESVTITPEGNDLYFVYSRSMRMELLGTIRRCSEKSLNWEFLPSGQPFMEKAAADIAFWLRARTAIGTIGGSA